MVLRLKICHTVVLIVNLQQGSQNKQLMDEINRLTAQTIAAEEAITYRDDQIKQLKMDNTRLKDDVDNTIPVLRAQVNS